MLKSRKENNDFIAIPKHINCNNYLHSQMLTNYKLQSAEGLSLYLLYFWLAGIYVYILKLLNG